MNLEEFKERFKSMGFGEKLEIYNNYVDMTDSAYHDFFYPFEPENINSEFETPFEAVEAVLRGDIKWNDNYYIYNDDGNLEGLTHKQAEEMMDNAVEEIFNFIDDWDWYFDND